MTRDRSVALMFANRSDPRCLLVEDIRNPCGGPAGSASEPGDAAAAMPGPDRISPPSVCAAIGKTVTIHGLQSVTASHLNSSVGLILEMPNTDEGRFKVEVSTQATAAQIIKIKHANFAVNCFQPGSIVVLKGLASSQHNNERVGVVRACGSMVDSESRYTVTVLPVTVLPVSLEQSRQDILRSMSAPARKSSVPHQQERAQALADQLGVPLMQGNPFASPEAFEKMMAEAPQMHADAQARPGQTAGQAISTELQETIQQALQDTNPAPLKKQAQKSKNIRIRRINLSAHPGSPEARAEALVPLLSMFLLATLPNGASQVRLMPRGIIQALVASIHDHCDCRNAEDVKQFYSLDVRGHCFQQSEGRCYGRPLELAALDGDVQGLRTLVGLGVGREGRPVACLNPSIPEVSSFASADGSVVSHDIAIAKVRTPNEAVAAAKNGHVKCLRFLHSAGFDVLEPSYPGGPGADIASLIGYTHADANGEDDDRRGNTQEHFECFEFLHSVGADMSKTHSRAGNTPLHCAAHFRRHSAMRIICSDLERANINVTNAQGLTPAHIACAKDDAIMLKILASEHSCDLTIPCSDGSTPSLIACRNCSAGCLRVLADRLGSKIEDGAEGTWSLSPVHLCCNSAESTTHAKGAECLEIMSRAGCDLDKLVPVHGFNAVRIACENGNLAALRVLHNAGCNLSNVSNTGSTPGHVAADENHVHILRYLHEAGVDLGTAKHDGSTPAFVATFCGSLSALQYLHGVGYDAAQPDSTGRTATETLYELAKQLNQRLGKDRLACVAFLDSLGD